MENMQTTSHVFHTITPLLGVAPLHLFMIIIMRELTALNDSFATIFAIDTKPTITATNIPSAMDTMDEEPTTSKAIQKGLARDNGWTEQGTRNPTDANSDMHRETTDVTTRAKGVSYLDVYESYRSYQDWLVLKVFESRRLAPRLARRSTESESINLIT
jgi:hypothetical protein